MDYEDDECPQCGALIDDDALRCPCCALPAVTRPMPAWAGRDSTNVYASGREE